MKDDVDDDGDDDDAQGRRSDLSIGEEERSIYV